MQNGFLVIHGNRQEDLRDVMLQWLVNHPLPVFSAEEILVQSNGMKQWLMQAFAEQTGLFAASQVYLPHEFAWKIYRQLLGATQVPQQMVYDKAPLTWRILRLLHQIDAQQDTRYQVLIDYLAVDASQLRFYHLAAQIADLYDQYQSYRADWIQLWSSGIDALIDNQGQQAKLPDGHSWQSRLWRDIQHDIQSGQTDIANEQPSRASIHRAAIQHLQTPQALTTSLPKRIVLFGISSLPQQLVELMATLGQYCQVILFVNNPCQYYWGDVQLDRYRRRHAIKAGKLLAQSADYANQHHLLASWGQQGKDYIQLLSEYDEHDTYAEWFNRIDVFVEQPAQHHLAALQNSFLTLSTAQPQPADGQAIDTQQLDHSIYFASSYSTQREVDALHDYLLALFDAQPDLRPEDIIVMMPNVDTFSAHIKATFNRFNSSDQRYIPFNLADSAQAEEPIRLALAWLLDLPKASFGLHECLALFEVEAIRHAFALSEAEVVQLTDWLYAAGVRWGLNAKQRLQQGQLSVDNEQNSWWFGIKRLLLGYAQGKQDSAWQGILPSGEIGSSQTNQFAALLHWMQRIESTQTELMQAHSVSEWQRVLSTLLDDFFISDVNESTQRWIHRFQRALTAWAADCEAARFDEPISIDVVKTAWLEKIDAQASLSRPFMSGGVQFATLMPMRAIPFKVICLIGMNEADYPRRQPQQDFDLMQLNQQQRRSGDRSRRHDDRYLFLEAILSAREQLYISWVGRSIVDNSPKLPSVLVSQLIDFFQQEWQLHVAVQQHPLQAFSTQYLQPNAHLKTYAREWFTDANQQISHNPRASEQLQRPYPASLALAQLQQLLRYPQRVFWRNSLAVYFSEVGAQHADEEVFVLDGLTAYGLKVDWFTSHTAATDTTIDIQQWQQNLQQTGQLALASFAELQAQMLAEEANQLLNNWQKCLQGYQLTPPLALNISINQCTTVQADIRSLYQSISDESQWLNLHYHAGEHKKGTKFHYLISGWLSHLFLTAAGYPVTTQIVAVDKVMQFNPLPVNEAKQALQNYVDLYHQASQRLFATTCKSGALYCDQWQQKQKKNDDPVNNTLEAIEAARQQINGGDYSPAEYDYDAELNHAFANFEQMLAHGFVQDSQHLYQLMIECLNEAVL